MANLKSITVLVDSSQKVVSTGQMLLTPPPDCDELIIDLKKHSSAKVVMVDDNLQAVTTEGFIILHSDDFEFYLNEYYPNPPLTLLERVILIDLISDRDKLFEILKRFKIAAAIGRTTYWSWMTEGEMPSYDGLYGLTSIAEEMDAEISSKESEIYCSMRDVPFLGLPSLLIHYLELYSKRIIQKEDKSSSLETLLSELERVEGTEQYDIVTSLSRIRDARAANALVELLNDHDWVVRIKAIRGLIRYDQSFGLPFNVTSILGNVLNQDSDERVQNLALRWLTDYANNNNLDISAILYQALVNNPTRKSILWSLQGHVEALDLDFRPLLQQISTEVQNEEIRDTATRWLDEIDE